MSDFNLEIEWDPAKAEGTVSQHGVSFVLAATVFRDPLSLTVFDSEHSEGEQRWITIGRADNTWADTSGASAQARIISAREAKNSERLNYEES